MTPAFPLSDSAESSPLQFRERVGLEVGVSSFKRADVSVLGGMFGSRFVGIYSSAEIANIYQLRNEKVRFGMLAAPVSGGMLFAWTALGFSSIEGLNFMRNYGALLFLPSYVLNPEFRLMPLKEIKLYSGYSFDLVQDKRIRPIYSLRAGGVIDVSKKMPNFRLGYEKISYRGDVSDNYCAALLFPGNWAP